MTKILKEVRIPLQLSQERELRKHFGYLLVGFSLLSSLSCDRRSKVITNSVSLSGSTSKTSVISLNVALAVIEDMKMALVKAGMYQPGKPSDS